jgi:hypothetical protein
MAGCWRVTWSTSTARRGEVVGRLTILGYPADVITPRHSSTTGLLRWFAYDHLRDDLRAVSQPFGELAHTIAERLPDGPELTTCLRKLLEAKDCAVRAAIDQRGA